MPKYSRYPRTGKQTRHFASAVAQQVRWITEHGGTLAGYVLRYGSMNDPNRYGDGGEAIFAADMAELEKLSQCHRRALFHNR